MWCLRAAQNNCPEAQYQAALFYHLGHLVTPDEEKVAKFFLAAAEGGHEESMVNVGICFKNGIGVNQDEKEAEKWFSAAEAHQESS
mmetsp:Transcript_31699/g.51275  ORF Transcript_31699/g.51275 Transcript_31699/m.51275 type:complete len:86 (+) Transcript_31699:2647-2904(+)